MEDDVIELKVPSAEGLELRHQIGMALLGAVTCLVASKVSNKAYLVGLGAYRQKFGSKS